MSRLQNRPKTIKEEKEPINLDFLIKNKTILIRSLGVLIVGLLVIWFVNSEDSQYEDLMDRYRIDNLVQDQYYDEALKFLDAFILDPKYESFKSDLEQKRSNILLLQEELSYSLPIDSLFLETESLLAIFRVEESLKKLELALEKGKYEDEQRAKIEERILKYQEFQNGLDNDGTLRVVKDYRVKTGETLNGIAYKYKMQPAELKILNKFKSVSLREGQFIKVKADVKIVKHIVQSGETLSAIAVKYGMSINEIKQLNRKETNSLQSGEILRVMQKVEIKMEEEVESGE